MQNGSRLQHASDFRLDGRSDAIVTRTGDRWSHAEVC